MFLYDETQGRFFVEVITACSSNEHMSKKHYLEERITVGKHTNMAKIKSKLI